MKQDLMIYSHQVFIFVMILSFQKQMQGDCKAGI
jgi:hypothetical protein